MDIEQLTNLMQQQANQEAASTYYDEQQARANALRGTNYGTRMMTQGQGSYAGLLADLVAGSRGRQLEREIAEPRRASAEGAKLAKAKAQAMLAKRKFDLEERDQANYAQQRDDRLSKRSVMDMLNTTTNERETIVSDGRGGFYDGQGNPVNISDYVKYFKPSASRGGSGGGFKPSAGERKTYRMTKRLKGVLGALEAERDALSDTSRAELDQPVAQAAASVLPSSGQRLVEEKMYKTPEVKSYVTRLNRVESKLSQLAAGLNVTGYEMKDRQRWSPNAPGITDDERQRRLNNIDRDLFGEIYLYEEMYDPAFHVSEFDEREALGLDKPEDKQSADPFAGFSAEEVK